MNTKKIVYTPFENKNNAYINITKNILAELGFTLMEFNSKNLNDCDYIIFNWWENLPNNCIKKIYYYIQKYHILKALKRKGTKIITVFHNKQPHDNKVTYLQKKIIDKLFFFADKIIILSKQSVEFIENPEYKEKTFYIPHPNYIEENKKKYIERNISNKLNLMFFGLVRPYKNIELILDIATSFKNEPINFKIVGHPFSSKYKEYIQQQCKNIDNVQCDLRFIGDNEISELFENCDVLILPYDQQSSLNSGTVILSFSNKKTVICPKISTLGDFDSSDFYSYSYLNEKEHKEELYKTVKMILNDYKKDKKIIEDKGYRLYKEVAKNNSKNAIKEKYVKLFEELEL